MHPDTRNIAADMQEFGLATLGRAANDLTFSQNMHDYASSMAIGAAGHGAELIIKARIAQEHPLLLFYWTAEICNRIGHAYHQRAVRTRPNCHV